METPTYRDPTGLARTLIVLLSIDLALACVSAVNSLGLVVTPTGRAGDEWYTTTLAAALIGSLGVYVISAVVWLLWLRRLHRNTTAFGVQQHYGIGWTWGGWIVPIGSLWIPKRLTDELTVSIDPQKHSAPLALANWWWGLFIASNLLGQVFLRSDVEFAPLSLVADILAVALGCVAIVLVTRITERHVLRREAQLACEINPEAPLPRPTRSDGAKRLVAGVAGVTTVVAFGAAVAFGPDAVDIVPIGDMAVGDCFVSVRADLSEVGVVACGDGQEAQIVGRLEVIASAYPGEERIFEHSGTSCNEQAEINTSMPTNQEGLEVFIVAPDTARWTTGDHTAVCIAFSEPDADSLISPSDRAAWADLEVGECYSSTPGFFTYAPTPCTTAEFAVDAKEPLAAAIDSRFPGQAMIEWTAQRTCQDANALWYGPNSESWQYGDRVIVCVRVPEGGV